MTKKRPTPKATPKAPSLMADRAASKGNGPKGLDPERKRQLEEERDFLMKSLDDLELEHDSGGIDDESYAELHDDYTARAAAVIRTLRDGVDVTYAPPPQTPHGTRRRIRLVAGVLVFAIVAGVSLGVRGRRPVARPDRIRQLAGGAVDDECDRRRAGEEDRRAPDQGERRVPTTTTSGSSCRRRTRRTATCRTR